MGRSGGISNLRDVTERLGQNKWKRAGQILRSYGLRGLLSRVRDKMRTGVDPSEDTERAYVLSNESCVPKRMQLESQGTTDIASFHVDPAADNAAMLEILTEGRSERAQLRVEVFHQGDRLAEATATVNEGLGYTTVQFPPVLYPADGRLTFVATVTGKGGIVVDRRRPAHGLHLEGGGRIFVRLYASVDPVYLLWMYHNDPTDEELRRQSQVIFEDAPTFSIVVPMFNTPERYLREMIQSVIAQTYPRWELCLVDGSTDGLDRQTIVSSFSDARIRYQKLERNEGICGNSNRAVAMSTGDFVCLLDHDDILAPHALFSNASMLAENPACDFIYSDEDKISDSGTRRFSPFFKPDYSPNLLNSFNYITHFSVFRRTLMDGEDWFRQGFDGAQDYDLILRVAERARNIGHIPDVLYHWRTAPTSTAVAADTKNYTESAALRALNESLARRGVTGAEAVSSVQPNRFDIRYPVPSPAPRVSVLVAADEDPEVTAACVEAILSSTTYPDYEILVAHTAGSTAEARVFDKMTEKDSRVRAVRCENSGSSSSILNIAARASTGELLAFADPRTLEVSEDWLQELAAQVLRDDVAAAGGLVANADGSVRSAGYTLLAGGIAGGVMEGYPGDHPGSFGRLWSVRDVSAVSSSCMMISRSLFQELGGLEEDFPSLLADTDLFLRARQTGGAIVFTPKARVRTASPPKGLERQQDAEAKWLRKWLSSYPRDPYGNPNLSLERADYATSPHPRGQEEQLVLERCRKRLDGVEQSSGAASHTPKIPGPGHGQQPA